MFGALLSAGASIVGGLMGRKDAENQRERDKKDKKKQFIELRKAAERGGFNPLTALAATGTGGFGNIAGGAPPLASTQMLVDGFKGVTDAFSGQAAREAERQELELDLAKIKLDQARGDIASNEPPAQFAGGTTFRLPRSVAVPRPAAVEQVEQMGVPSGGGLSTRPAGRPGLWSKGGVPLIRPDGQSVLYSKKVADRLGLGAFDALIVEDYEAIYGDELGQGVALPQLPGAVIQNEGGVLK